MLNILTQAVALKVVVATVLGPIGATTILQDLKSIDSSTLQFENAMIPLTPVSLRTR